MNFRKIVALVAVAGITTVVPWVRVNSEYSFLPQSNGGCSVVETDNHKTPLNWLMGKVQQDNLDERVVRIFKTNEKEEIIAAGVGYNIGGGLFATASHVTSGSNIVYDGKKKQKATLVLNYPSKDFALIRVPSGENLSGIQIRKKAVNNGEIAEIATIDPSDFYFEKPTSRKVTERIKVPGTSVHHGDDLYTFQSSKDGDVTIPGYSGSPIFSGGIFSGVVTAQAFSFYVPHPGETSISSSSSNNTAVVSPATVVKSLEYYCNSTKLSKNL